MVEGKRTVKLPPQRGEVKRQIFADMKEDLDESFQKAGKLFRKAGNAVLFLVHLQNPTRQYKCSSKAISATRKCCSIAVATRSFSFSGCCAVPKASTASPNLPACKLLM